MWAFKYVCVYVHVLEWHFLFWSSLPDTQQMKSNITAMKNIGNAWLFSHNDICFDNINIFLIWAKKNPNSDDNQKVILN